MVALHYGEIKWNSERISNIKPFINKYHWDEIKYPSKLDDWKTFEKNNSIIVLNVLNTKQMEIFPAYISKYNSNCKKIIALLVLCNENGWHYFALKKLSALLREITSKHNGDFYCLNYLHSFGIEKKLYRHEKVCKNKDFSGIALPTQKNKIIKFNQYTKSDKPPCTVYADLGSLIRKIDNC